MDYLPQPHDSVPGIDVALVEIKLYDFGSYEFPECHGYTRSDGSWDTEQSPDNPGSILGSLLSSSSFGQDRRATLVIAALVKDLIKANYCLDNRFLFDKWDRGQLNMTCLRSAERALNEYQKLDEFTYLVPPIVLSV